MSNTSLLLDILAGYLTVMLKAQKLLSKAANEGRDVSRDELNTLRTDNDKLEKSILDPR